MAMGFESKLSEEQLIKNRGGNAALNRFMIKFPDRMPERF
jgi:hypothetical protein